MKKAILSLLCAVALVVSVCSAAYADPRPETLDTMLKAFEMIDSGVSLEEIEAIIAKSASETDKEIPAYAHVIACKAILRELGQGKADTAQRAKLIELAASSLDKFQIYLNESKNTDDTIRTVMSLYRVMLNGEKVYDLELLNDNLEVTRMRERLENVLSDCEDIEELVDEKLALFLADAISKAEAEPEKLNSQLPYPPYLSRLNSEAGRAHLHILKLLGYTAVRPHFAEKLYDYSSNIELYADKHCFDSIYETAFGEIVALRKLSDELMLTELEGKKVTLDLNDTSLWDMMVALSDELDIPVTASTEGGEVLDKNLSLKVVNMTAKEVLSFVTKNTGLKWMPYFGTITLFAKEPVEFQQVAKQVREARIELNNTSLPLALRRNILKLDSKMNANYADTPYSEIAKNLSDVSGVPIKLDDSATADREGALTGKFTAMRIRDLLEWLCSCAEWSYRIESEGVVIFKKAQ